MKQIVLLLTFLISFSVFSQKTIKSLLKKYNTDSIPYITADALSKIDHQVLMLDTREKNEYEVSHLKNAQFVGYDLFNIDSLIEILPEDKNKQIVVYCSLGIRSETIGLKLKKAGYNHVMNLYGGIFDWKNNDLPVYNSKGSETDSIHVFSKEWGKWLKKGTKVVADTLKLHD